MAMACERLHDVAWRGQEEEVGGEKSTNEEEVGVEKIANGDDEVFQLVTDDNVYAAPKIALIIHDGYDMP
ncbi:hypothetical protein SUGI_0752950 [Cryptomeria japonica]|nr:hypothetical protein SUGI_0752950 [Cryptomeria japonica]